MKLFVVLSVAVALAAGVPFQKEQKFTRTQRFGKIVGGSDATPGQFPPIVSLQYDMGFGPQHSCGGNIIDELTIATAAHCVTEVPSGGTYTALAGLHDQSDPNESNVQKRDVESMTIHEDYTGGVAPNDIAIFKLTEPLVFNDRVNKVNLPAQGDPVPADVTLYGWGYKSSSFPVTPDILQFRALPTITNAECADALTQLLGSSEPLDENMVCTGPLTGGVSSCGGDSGGPLVDASNTLCGIVSWGINPCGYDGAPSVYTKTSSFRDWIDTHS